jgi:hypothetical protein
LSATLPNFTAPDSYGDAGQLLCPKTVRVRFNINNAAIFWRRGMSPAGGQGIHWEEEEFLPPGVYSLNERCELLQVRAAIPAAEVEGLQAQVSIATRTAEDLQGGD